MKSHSHEICDLNCCVSLISDISLGKCCPGPVFCLLLGVSSNYAQPITGQVTEVTCPVIGRAQAELTLSKRQKTGVSSDYAQPITGQVTKVTRPVIGQAQPELTLSKRQKTGVSSDYAQPITGQVTEVIWPVIGRAHLSFTHTIHATAGTWGNGANALTHWPLGDFNLILGR